MFGLMRIINLAHGDLAVLGAYLTYLLLEHWNTSPFVAILPVIPVMLLIGYVLQRVILERSLRSGLLVPLLTTFGLSIVIQNLLDQGFSVDDRSLGAQAGSIATSSWQITSQLSIPAIGVLALGVAVVIYGGLQIFLSKTRSGRQMRATAQDPDTAELVGINSRAVYTRATAIAVAIAAIGGVFLAIRSSFSPYTGPSYLIFAFEAVVIGGLGSSLWATLAGGIVLGIAQTIGGQINTEYPVLAGHIVFLAVLLTPRGGLLNLRRTVA
jgi:branched-chain amino acid transport system permease protein